MSSAFRSEIKKQRTTSELTIASGSPTSLRTHESKNDPRQQRQDTSRLLQRAKAQQVALLGFQGRLTKMLPDEFKDVTMSERNAALRKCLYIPFHL